MAMMKTRSLENADSALMLSYAAGESEGFDLLYKRHKSAVFRFFYYGTNGNTDLAAELFQDVWMTVVRGRTRYNVDMRFGDWLHHVAWARLYDHIRLHPVDQRPVDQKFGEQKPGTQKKADNSPAIDIELPANVRRLHPHDKSDAKVVARVVTGGKTNAVEEVSLLDRLQNMPEDHREIVLLRYCFRMEFAEIATFLDVARSSVSRLHKEALVTLRNNIPEAC